MAATTHRSPSLGGRRLLLLRLGVFLIIVGSLSLLVWAIFFAADDGPDLPHEGKVGQEVTDGTLIYRVTSIRCGLASLPSGPEEKPENGQFCELTLEVRNPDDSQASWNAALTAGNGTYTPEWYLEKYSRQALTGRIEAGEHRTGWLIFDINRSADPVTLKLGIDVSSDAAARITL